MTLKEQFIADYENRNGDVKCIVVAMMNPSNGIDILCSYDHIFEKYKFYCDGTDNYFVLRSNVMCKIVNYMIV